MFGEGQDTLKVLRLSRRSLTFNQRHFLAKSVALTNVGLMINRFAVDKQLVHGIEFCLQFEHTLLCRAAAAARRASAKKAR